MKFMREEAIMEALLFAAGDPVPLSVLAKAVGTDVKTARVLLANLSDKYVAEKRGILILEMDNMFQMCTNPLYFDLIVKIYQTTAPKPLTQTALETLAIIAYKQPITKGQIEDIRGVNADHAVNKLMAAGLITEKGRQDTPGRPILFGTSGAFLKHFGLANLSQLPSLREDIAQIQMEIEAEIPDMANEL